jgi:hypothetical protein
LLVAPSSFLSSIIARQANMRTSTDLGVDGFSSSATSALASVTLRIASNLARYAAPWSSALTSGTGRPRATARGDGRPSARGSLAFDGASVHRDSDGTAPSPASNRTVGSSNTADGSGFRLPSRSATISRSTPINCSLISAAEPNRRWKVSVARS